MSKIRRPITILLLMVAAFVNQAAGCSMRIFECLRIQALSIPIIFTLGLIALVIYHMMRSFPLFLLSEFSDFESN